MPDGDLREGEWQAFGTPDPEQRSEDTFVTGTRVPLVADSTGGAQSKPVNAELARRIDKVVLALRLREVRALKGFSRYRYSEEGLTPSLGLELSPSWLPAIEVFGEGVFVSLNETAVSAWEALPDVDRRAGTLRPVKRNPSSDGACPAQHPDSFCSIRLPTC